MPCCFFFPSLLAWRAADAEDVGDDGVGNGGIRPALGWARTDGSCLGADWGDGDGDGDGGSDEGGEGAGEGSRSWYLDRLPFGGGSEAWGAVGGGVISAVEPDGVEGCAALWAMDSSMAAKTE